MIAVADTLGAMSKSPNAKRLGGPLSWEELSRPDADQNQRFLADSLSLLLADLLRSVLSDASPALPADESAVERYRNLADSLAEGEPRRRTSLGITRAGAAARLPFGKRVAPPHQPWNHPGRSRQAMCDLAQAAPH